MRSTITGYERNLFDEFREERNVHFRDRNQNSNAPSAECEVQVTEMRRVFLNAGQTFSALLDPVRDFTGAWTHCFLLDAGLQHKNDVRVNS